LRRVNGLSVGLHLIHVGGQRRLQPLLINGRIGVGDHHVHIKVLLTLGLRGPDKEEKKHLSLDTHVSCSCHKPYIYEGAYETDGRVIARTLLGICFHTV
jgi:hypothetical protein